MLFATFSASFYKKHRLLEMFAASYVEKRDSKGIKKRKNKRASENRGQASPEPLQSPNDTGTLN